MRKLIAPLFVLAGITVSAASFAQDDNKDDDRKKKETEEIVIRKKGDKDINLKVEINGDKIIVNGKPLAEFKDDAITINKRKMIIRDGDDMMSFHFDTDKLNDLANDLKEKSKELIERTKQQWKEDYGQPKAFLGVTTKDNEEGAEILSASNGSAAEKAGLQAGDIITKIDDQKVEGPGSLSEIITSYKPNDKVKIYFKREGKEKSTKVTLGETKRGRMSFAFKAPDGKMKSFTMPNIPTPPTPPMPPGLEGDDEAFGDLPRAFGGPDNEQFELFRDMSRPKLGLRIQDTEEGGNVKVIDVEEGSAAEKAGLQKNDLITEIGEKAVTNTDDAREQLRENKDKSSYTIKVNRNGSAKTFEVKIPKKLKTANL